MTLSKKYRYFKALYFVVFALLLILFIGNIFLDTNTDEFHYLATTYRFYLGDAMLVDDWSPEQMNAVLLLPFLPLSSHCRLKYRNRIVFSIFVFDHESIGVLLLLSNPEDK